MNIEDYGWSVAIENSVSVDDIRFIHIDVNREFDSEATVEDVLKHFEICECI